MAQKTARPARSPKEPKTCFSFTARPSYLDQAREQAEAMEQSMSQFIEEAIYTALPRSRQLRLKR